MDDIARDSRAAYRALVYDDPRFVEYFRLATPIDVIQRMEIGSRPASRQSEEQQSGEIERLRAIPWVFAWTQSRHLLPGWYGLGTALDRAAERNGTATLGDMLREWPFLRARGPRTPCFRRCSQVHGGSRKGCRARVEGINVEPRHRQRLLLS